MTLIDISWGENSERRGRISPVSFQEHRKGRQLKEEEEEEAEIIFDIKHTAPQHRQYLEFEVCRHAVSASLFPSAIFKGNINGESVLELI